MDRDFLSALSAPDAAALLRVGHPRRFAKNQALLREGQVPDQVLVLRTGRVKITSTTPTGHEVVIAFRGPGELLGELAAIGGNPRSANVVALEPVEALAMTPNAFEAFLAAHPSALYVLVQILVDRLRQADARRIEFVAHDTLGRVAKRLLELCDRYGTQQGDQIEIELPISQEELAGLANASPVSTSKALRDMRGLGWVETRPRRIRVLDAEALRRAIL